MTFPISKFVLVATTAGEGGVSPDSRSGMGW